MVYLYKYKTYIQLLQGNHNVGNINYPMITYNIKVYKGITNTLDFVIRNNDRQPVKLIGVKIEVTIQSTNPSIGQLPEILLTKCAKIIDDQYGKAQLILTPQDIQNWDTGYYKYVVKTIDGNGIEEYYFTDINKSAIGQFELIEGVEVSLQPAKCYLGKDFTIIPNGDYGQQYTTGAIPGDAQSQQANGTHTVAIYLREFSGKFWVQASLSNEPPYESDWFDVPLCIEDNKWTFDNYSGIKQFTFIGNYYWVRFRYIFDQINCSGKFEKLLYKN